MILGPFLAHHRQGRKDYVNQRRLESVFVAMANRQRPGSRLIDLKQLSIVVVIILASFVRTQEYGRKAQRRNVVASYLETGS